MPNVDAVSGATYSSAGILNAVNNALEAAVIDGQLEYEAPSDDRQTPEKPNHNLAVSMENTEKTIFKPLSKPTTLSRMDKWWAYVTAHIE